MQWAARTEQIGRGALEVPGGSARDDAAPPRRDETAVDDTLRARDPRERDVVHGEAPRMNAFG